MYEFIGDLSESRLIPSKSNLRKFTAQEVADLVVLNLCALYILWSNPEYQEFAEKYAKRTLAHGTKFDKWQTSGTDLYILLHALVSQNDPLNKSASSDKFRETLPIGESLLVRWLKDMSTDTLKDTQHRALFVKLDFNFRTSNNSIRAIRRLVMDWNKLERREHELAMTRLLQFMRARAARGEIVGTLQKMAKTYDLEMSDVCNPETGRGCDAPAQDHASHEEPEKKKGGGFLAGLAGLAIGAAINTAMHKK